MYVLFEYLTYIVVTFVLALLLFGATTLYLATQAGAKRLAEGSRRLATHAQTLVARIRAPRIAR